MVRIVKLFPKGITASRILPLLKEVIIYHYDSNKRTKAGKHGGYEGSPWWA